MPYILDLTGEWYRDRTREGPRVHYLLARAERLRQN